jgi:hypothetical protein
VVGIAGAGLTYFAVLCLPVGVAVAVLRYRLWDLDRLVGRTVTYALHAELLGVVDQTMQPTQASLWLRPPGREVPTGG